MFGRVRIVPFVLVLLAGCGEHEQDDDSHDGPCTVTTAPVSTVTSGAAQTGGASSTGEAEPGPGSSSSTSTSTTSSSGDEDTTSGGASDTDGAGESGESGQTETGDPEETTAADSTGSTGGTSESTGGTSESTGGSTGDSTGGDDMAGPSFAADVWPIFEDRCGCHEDNNGAGKLRLTGDDAYDNLVGKPSKQLDSMQLVAPGDAEMSYLWHKLNNTHKKVGGEGKRMPPKGLLDPAERDIVQQWIDHGAQP